MLSIILVGFDRQWRVHISKPENLLAIGLFALEFVERDHSDAATLLLDLISMSVKEFTVPTFRIFSRTFREKFSYNISKSAFFSKSETEILFAQ